MPPRNTRTGQVFEDSVLASLKFGGYEINTQVKVGTRPGGGKHWVDIVASKNERDILISMKWQQSSGTAEQKVPYEFMSLAKALSDNPDLEGAYIVLGGTGWTKKDFFIDELHDWVNTDHHVRVIRFEDFMAKANKGNL